MTTSDFTVFLPSEILTDIFSNVNQVDCIECMTACRRWHKLIPQYGRNAWTELEISGKSWSRCNNGMLEFLGSHVKKVSITSYKNANKIVRQLESHGCNIQSLEIKGIFQVHTFDLNRGTLVFSAGLFGTLKELFLIGRCTNDCPLEMLLNALPALTHLTYKLKYCYNFTPLEDYDSITSEIYRNIQAGNDDDYNNHSYNLVFLCLDSDIGTDHNIEKIIKRCPRLEYLLLSANVITEYYEPSLIDLACIPALCPSIRYIQWGEDTIPSSIKTQWLPLSRRRNMDNQYNSSNYEKREADHLHQVRFWSRIEDQHISTLRVCLQQPSLLECLRLSGSFGIDLCRVWTRFTQQNSNLLLQPSQLKSLDLVGFSIPHRTENNIFFENLFYHFQHIERLKMELYLETVDNVDKERNSIFKMFDAIGHQLHQLQCLHIDLSGCVALNTEMVLGDNLFTTLCVGNQKLEILHLSGVPITNDMMLDLCHHPTLHTLNLSGYELHEQVTKDGWISFARKLKEEEQNGCGKIQSMLLSTGPYNGVTDEVLQELAGIKSLENLRIERNWNITDAGVNKFASIKSSNSKNHKRIELYDCKKVSSDNPYVLFVRSSFCEYKY